MQIWAQSDKAPLLRELPSRLLWQTAVLVSKVVGESLTAEGTHRHQFATLATLEAFGASSQAELCRRTDLDRSDMNAVINALALEGSVKRYPDPHNRRQNIVELTEFGHSRFQHLREKVLQAQNLILAPLSQSERVELVRLLQVLHDHLALKSESG
jgi:DNA-binding MarR family transcriptional regulator